MKAIEQVTLFYEISNALNEHLDLKKSMYKVLDIPVSYTHLRAHETS